MFAKGRDCQPRLGRLVTAFHGDSEMAVALRVAQYHRAGGEVRILHGLPQVLDRSEGDVATRKPGDPVRLRLLREQGPQEFDQRLLVCAGPTLTDIDQL